LHSHILAPVIALVLWSFGMWAWLYATRIPVVVKGKVVIDPNHLKGEFDSQLPARVRWKADNYNHLMEQPTLFYAVALTLALLDAGEGRTLGLAWIYVGLRGAYSFVQALTNIILLRFSLFMVASMVLLVMATCGPSRVVGCGGTGQAAVNVWRGKASRIAPEQSVTDRPFRERASVRFFSPRR
jgi:hypothetical protein